MTRTETFKFNINDKVLVNEIQRPGVVMALMIDYLGPQYMVYFWDNGDRRKEWLYEGEISTRT